MLCVCNTLMVINTKCAYHKVHVWKTHQICLYRSRQKDWSYYCQHGHPLPTPSLSDPQPVRTAWSNHPMYVYIKQRSHGVPSNISATTYCMCRQPSKPHTLQSIFTYLLCGPFRSQGYWPSLQRLEVELILVMHHHQVRDWDKIRTRVGARVRGRRESVGDMGDFYRLQLATDVQPHIHHRRRQLQNSINPSILCQSMSLVGASIGKIWS